jgi:hypothetical protein
MDSPEVWQIWARTLQRNHLTGFVITLLEGAAPVRTIISQTLLGISPFFTNSVTRSLSAFAETLDNEKECRDFASFLETEIQHEQR